jgi:hypothetical protein
MAEPARLDPPAPAPSPLDALPRIAARGAPAPADFAALVAAEMPVVIKGLFDDWRPGGIRPAASTPILPAWIAACRCP